MAKYKVTVFYKGSVELTVEADSVDEARENAVEEFEDVSDMEVVANIEDISTSRECVIEEDDDDT